MNTTSEVVRVKEAFAWVEDGREIHLKAVASSGQPVVLTADETRRLAERASGACSCRRMWPQIV
jgi:hypothetical protein